VSTAEAVVNYFSERIRSGLLKAGDALPSERTLQAELGVSRFALREGLARLNALGIITSAQGKPSVVNAEVSRLSLESAFLPMEAQDAAKYAEDLFYSRDLIEGATCQLAARNRTKKDVKRLSAILDEMGAVIADHDAFTQLDLQFHRGVVETGGNVFLQKIHELLQAQLIEAIALSTRQQTHRNKSLAWHRTILDSIADGDPQAAAEAMSAHLSACKVAYKKSST
jgi:DNA-binding FadR family transcriptional regulator